ncbi:HflX-like GTP-binding protein [Streptomyces sp. NPDC003042]
MHQHRERARRPGRRVRTTAGRRNAPVALPPLAGAEFVLVGYFSAKRKDFTTVMDAAAADLTVRGARIVGRFVQRRGVSDGGVRKMALPYSSRTVLRYGKVREVAAARELTGADAVVFVHSLTERQQRVLSDLFGCPALGLAQALAAG